MLPARIDPSTHRECEFRSRRHQTNPTVLLQEALEKLLSVEEEGGVTVRRHGNGKLKRWHYGYR